MRSGLVRAVVVCILVVMLALALAPPFARADGDPASDVLLGENVFYPYAPPVSAAIQKQLDAETAAASRAHHPIKVALIASPVDLGVVTSLFGRPQKYADFLEQEISYQTKQALLVVMPSGYGVQGLAPAARTVAASLSRPAGRQSDDLARAAISAVGRLATAAGHPIKGASASGRSSSGTGGRSSALLLAVLVALAVVTAAALIAIRRREAGSR